MRTWTQFDPKHLFPQETGREYRNRARNRLVGLLRPFPLGVIAQEDRRVIADALGHGMDRNAGIEQGSRVDASEVVKSRLAKAGQVGLAGILSEQIGLAGKLLGEVARVAGLGEVEVLA